MLDGIYTTLTQGHTLHHYHSHTETCSLDQTVLVYMVIHTSVVVSLEGTDILPLQGGRGHHHTHICLYILVHENHLDNISHMSFQ